MQPKDKRPVGRPPMKCEDIQLKTRRKTQPFIEKAVVKKCTDRSKKQYPPYKCMLTPNKKCVTYVEMKNNPLYSPSSKSSSVAKSSTKSSKMSVKNNPLYSSSSKSSSSKSGTTKSASPNPRLIIKDNPLYSASASNKK